MEGCTTDDSYSIPDTSSSLSSITSPPSNPESSNNVQALAEVLNCKLYGTAASRRSPRNRLSQPRYSSFFEACNPVGEEDGPLTISPFKRKERVIDPDNGTQSPPKKIKKSKKAKGTKSQPHKNPRLPRRVTRGFAKSQKSASESLEKNSAIVVLRYRTSHIADTSFGITNVEDQCAQSAVAPVPASYRVDPIDESQAVQPKVNSQTTSHVNWPPSHPDPATSCIPFKSQHQLHIIAKRLFSGRGLDVPKPAPLGQPEVWAESRQELCETLHYFRSYQSGSYCTGGFARGFMFDKIALVARAGGGLIKDRDSGEMKAGRDQSDDSPTTQSLKASMKHLNPVVIITGIDNPHMPSQQPHQYCVLDYFKPTHVWFEKSNGNRILRYRFEKFAAQRESWWSPKDKKDPFELGSLGLPVQRTCEYCSKVSMQVYLNGWMCLQPTCAVFWHVENEEPEEALLVYDPRFLKQKTPWPNENDEYPLVTSKIELSAWSVIGEDTSRAFWSGIVCPDCGRCSSRLNWMGWECLGCDFKIEPSHSPVPAVALREPWWPISSSYTLSRDTHSTLVNTSISFAHGYRIQRYTIPGIDGFITHMIANKTIVEEASGPNEMFENLQKTDIGLRRRPLPNGQLKGESYCRQFMVNYGMPYKFIAATASRPFSPVADPITSTRSRLNWAAKHLFAQETGKTMAEVTSVWKEKEFNEVLALGYFEGQKINYHDDGELGLGPTIATLSLGAPGAMRIRMKCRYYRGCSATGIYDDSRPLPGCESYTARIALQPVLGGLKVSNPAVYRARLKELPRELKLTRVGNAKDVLKMELGHGDIVVMHGAELQKYYEHAVEHAGKLRFALTCRYIDPESVAEGEKPGYIVGVDEGEYDGARIT
ncbi:hypothetical protein GQ44DRAFT_829984 [Phaeosphaeriaceae sp. PMI808]|nr:hypothetical protein GQ44DRAFT_829984 [Phaeosphaeriaceae sp. PMI808]